MTDESEKTTINVHCRELAADVTVATKDEFISFWKNKNAITEGAVELDDDAFRKLVARMAFGGIPETVEDSLDKLMELEAAAAEAEGVERKRKARAGVADTPFVVPTDFRAYKRIIKGALVAGVELLTVDGYPKGKREVLRELELANASEPKTAIQKLGPAANTLVAILAKCESGDRAGVEAIKLMVEGAFSDWLTSH